MTSRPAIPQATKDAVFVEAGHRCSIPTCRTTSPLVLAHIVPWSKTKDSSPENLIVLCKNCHARREKGDINQKSLRMYKNNLKILNSRYNDFEKRVFEHIINQKFLLVGAGADILLHNAIKDGIVFIFDIDIPLGKIEFKLDPQKGYLRLKEPFPTQFLIGISPYGEAFVQALQSGNPLDDVDQSLPKDAAYGEDWRDYFYI